MPPANTAKASTAHVISTTRFQRPTTAELEKTMAEMMAKTTVDPSTERKVNKLSTNNTVTITSHTFSFSLRSMWFALSRAATVRNIISVSFRCMPQ